MNNREEDLSRFQKSLERIRPLNKQSLGQIYAITDRVSLCKGDPILPFGKTCRHLYFVDEGFLRIYYLKNGKEITEWFADEGEFCFSIESYFRQQPSTLCIEALEDSSILRISRSGLQQLTGENIEIANLLLDMYSGSLVLSQERMNSIQFESASERYARLESDHPNIILKAPLQHIASYLGITSETLSRIRANRN